MERERERDLEKERERDLDPDLEREERDPDLDLLVLDISASTCQCTSCEDSICCAYLQEQAHTLHPSVRFHRLSFVNYETRKKTLYKCPIKSGSEHCFFRSE